MGAALLAASILLSVQDPSAAPAAPEAATALPSPRPIASPLRKIGSGAPAEPSPAGFVLWTFAVLGIMAGAAAILRRFLGRSRLFAASGPIAVVARRSLGPRQELILVDVGRRLLLIGATRDRLTLLAELQDGIRTVEKRGRHPEDAGSVLEEREPLQALGA